ncbi:MAG: ATP-binding protein [Thermodesulfobacteriaceae bacterium]|nr:ATP-binding protein [Thermodesulfobacteriaceae bacterium]
MFRDVEEIFREMEEELERVFADVLKDKDLSAIREWYNGYSFLGEPVYNPFDILLYLSEGQFRPFWFETGTPEFLIKLLTEKHFFLPELEELIVTEHLLDTFDVGHIEPEVLLFQTGYLTVKEYEASREGVFYKLSYPNREVKEALNKNLSAYLTGSWREVERGSYEVRKALKEGNLDKFERILRSLFASIPYEWYRKNELERFEGYYVSVVYSFLCGAGLPVIGEDFTNKGRIDLTILLPDRAYLLEFKVVEEDETSRAIEALKSKNYQEKYKERCQEIYLVGIEFSKKDKNISTFNWEKL